MTISEAVDGQTPAATEYTIRHSPARQRRGMRAHGLFRQTAPGLSICVSDHFTRGAALADLQARGGQLASEVA